MRFQVDEDLPQTVTSVLQRAGYEAVSVMEQRLGGLKDPLLWRAVQTEQRFPVMADKGYGDTRLFPPGTHGSILVLRPDQDGMRPVIELLGRVLADYDLRALAGMVSVATPRGLRIGRAKAQG